MKRLLSILILLFTLFSYCQVDNSSMLLQASKTQYANEASYDADAQAFIDAHGSLTTAEEIAVNDYVVGAKADGFWTKCHIIYVYIGGTAANHKWNLKNPLDTDAAFRQTFEGSGASHSSGAGFNGNGTAWANTHYSPSADNTQNNSHISMYLGTDNANNEIDIGCRDGSNQTRFSMEADYAGSFAGDMYYFPQSRVSASNADARGYYVLTRTDATTVKAFKNNVQLGSTETGSAGTIPVTTFYVAVWNNNGSLATSLASTKDFRLVTVGDGVTDTEASDMYTRAEALQDALSRGVN